MSCTSTQLRRFRDVLSHLYTPPDNTLVLFSHHHCPYHYFTPSHNAQHHTCIIQSPPLSLSQHRTFTHRPTSHLHNSVTITVTITASHLQTPPDITPALCSHHHCHYHCITPRQRPLQRVSLHSVTFIIPRGY